MNQNQQPMQFYCSQCQTPVTIYNKKCPGCGIELYFDPKYYDQENYGTSINETAVFNQSTQQNYMKSDGTTVLNQSMMPGYEGKQTNYNYGQQLSLEQKPMKMKWYKFVIYVQLFLTALMGLSNFGNYMSGNFYGEYAESVYAFYGNGLKMLDMIMAVLSILVAPMAIIVRQKLAHFKTNGPKLYLALYIYNIIISIIYIVLAGVVLEVPFNMIQFIQFILSIAVYALIIILNRIYFKKRSYLFCN